MLDIASTNEEEADVVANPTTGSGKPATFDGPLRVTLQSGDATFRQDPATPNTVTFVSGAPGVSEFLVEGDADRDPGEERLLQEVVRYTVSGAEAEAFGLSAGAVRPKA